MYSNVIKERNNDFNFIPPFLKVEKVDYLEKYSKFLAPPFLKVDVDELLHMRTCEKLRTLFKESFGKYGANGFSL